MNVPNALIFCNVFISSLCSQSRTSINTPKPINIPSFTNHFNLHKPTMETTFSLFSNHSLPSPLPFRPPSKTLSTKILASKRDAHSHNFDGNLVDQNMIVLRMRIHEMTMSEKSYEPPRHWMEWEKEYKKAYYDLDVCEAVGFLQYKLMETRPGFALGMALLLLLSLPTSFAIVLFHLMHLIKGF